MNKDTIKHYKKEFNHWLGGGSLMAYYPLDTEPKWIKASDKSAVFFDSPISQIRYIIDDEYIEFRKAQAEGKTIEVYQGGWYNIKECNNLAQNFNLKPAKQYYRIKPAHEFKIGDWVTTEGRLNGEDKRFLAIVTGENRCELMPKNTSYSSYKTSLEDAEPWKPVQGEWCVFHSDPKPYGKEMKIIEYVIRQYCHSNEERREHYSLGGGFYRNVKPLEFAQTLKNK